MRTGVEHLPQTQQDELARVVAILMEEFETATARATQPWRKNGMIYKIILFGSYALEDWVDEPENGYQSDFDLLIVVSHRDLTEIADYWYVAEDRTLRDAAIGRPVNTIVHSIDEVNQALKRGEYFWVDISRDGITLYELPRHELAAPMPLTPADALEMATSYFNTKLGDVDVWIETAAAQSAKDDNQERYRRHAAFNLHQAVEAAYACFLLVRTLYFPRSHNIKFLRSLSEDKEPRLIAAWPRAYVEARYSANYQISRDDLEALTKGVRDLRELVESRVNGWSTLGAKLRTKRAICWPNAHCPRPRASLRTFSFPAVPISVVRRHALHRGHAWTFSVYFRCLLIARRSR